MNKKYFAVKLNPPRPDFAFTMTEDEKSIMQQHVSHWKEFMSKGNVVVFGPVLDPKTAYGFGILAVDEEQEVKDFLTGDPAADICTYEFHPMLAEVPQK